MMRVKKQLCGHGDPLLVEVVAGLEETLASSHDGKTLGGARGVGERTFSKGDALLTECERYHQAEHDHQEAHQLALHLRPEAHQMAHQLALDLRRIKFNPPFDLNTEEYVLPHHTLMQLKAMEEALEVAPQEGDLLSRRKDDRSFFWFFSPYAEAMPDPVLDEYVLPGTTLLELKALKEDMIKKLYILGEMKMRRDRTAERYELPCDPLVLPYRRREQMSQKVASPKLHVKFVPEEVKLTKYRELNGDDGLLNATVEYRVIPSEVTKYRKVDAGDDLLHAASLYHCNHIVTSE